MTALLYGILVDKGILFWDTTIQDVFGEGYPMRDEYRQITLRLPFRGKNICIRISVMRLRDIWRKSLRAGNGRASCGRESFCRGYEKRGIRTACGGGWSVGETGRGLRYITHDGSNTMFYCRIVVFPDTADAVVVMTNRGDGQSGRKAAELVLYFAESFLGATVR